MNDKKRRRAPLEMTPEAFRRAGYQVIDQMAGLLAELPRERVSPEQTAVQLRNKLGGQRPMPKHGTPVEQLLDETAVLLRNHSTFNGHPRFWGYITSSAAPIGALGDLMAAMVNANVGSFKLAPIATEIEQQAVGWLADLIGYPHRHGLLLSGGNMANMAAFWAARRAKAGETVRQEGVSGRSLVAYASTETHTWIDNATDLSGLGLQAVRRIPVDGEQRLKTAVLQAQIEADIAAGYQPFLVIGTAGTTSTGAIDPLPELALICQQFDLWFHVDGAYGAFAAMLPDAPQALEGMHLADSIAVDPHKWLYAPLEAGCLLVRNPDMLIDTFSFRPDYYHLAEAEDAPPNFYEYGPQNSRGFRALKVWLGLRQAGRRGYEQMLGDDVCLAEKLFALAQRHPELEAVSHNLSITTFRYVPPSLPPDFPEREAYLSQLNTTLLEQLWESGDFFLSNAVVNGRFLLRACVVNFRTTLADVDPLPEIVARNGRSLDANLRPTFINSMVS